VLVTVVGLVLVVGGEAYDAVTADNKRSMSRSVTDRNRVDRRLLLVGLLIVVSLPLLSVMMLPSGTTDMGIRAADSPDPNDPGEVNPGEISESEIPFENAQPVPMVVIVEPVSDSVEIQDQRLFVGAGGTEFATVRVQAPEERGVAVRVRSEQFYLPLLPPGLIHGLHSIHPILALTAVMSVVWIPIGFGYWLTVGFGYIKLRDVS
jgi:signal peptidase